MPMENDLIICDGCNDKILTLTTYLLCFNREGQTFVNRCICDKCKEKNSKIIFLMHNFL